MQLNIDFKDNLSDRQINQLVDLYQNEWWTKNRTKAEVEIMIKNSNYIFAYFDKKDNLIGFARVLTDGIFKAFLFDIITKKEFRGCGLGSRIVNDMINHPDISQVKHIELYCLPELVGFYARFGFSSEVGSINLLRRIN